MLTARPSVIAGLTPSRTQRKRNTLIALSFVCTTLGWSGASHAIYQWQDSEGRVVFSDLPPPKGSGVRNLRERPPAPNLGLAPAIGVTAPDPNKTSSDSKAPLPDTPSTRWEARQQAKIKQDEAQQKLALEQAAAAKRQQECQRLSNYRKTLESGRRVATTAADGELNFLDDVQRQAEINRSNRELRENCS